MGLHQKLLNTVLNATFTFISNVDSGSLMNRFNQDMMLVDMKLPLDFFNTAATLFTFVVQVILISVAAVYVLSILPVISVVLYLIQHFYLRTSKQLRHLDLETKSGLHTKVTETSEGLITIRAHGWQDAMREEFDEKLDRSQEPLYLLYMVQRWLQLTMNLVVAGVSITVTGAAVGMGDKTSVGAIGVALLNMTTLGETMTNLMTSWTSLETSLGAIARIQAFEEDTPIEHKVDSPVEVPVNWPESGSISIDNLWTSYNSETDNPIWSLKEITFDIRAGEKIAVCGRTGSGKSTFLITLLALLETKKGSINIDGIDISRIERSTLRSRFSVISQDAFQQGDTVREALDASGEVSDEAICEILLECALLDKITASGGLSGLLADVNLSVGEAQLFSLARTILHAGSKNGGIVLLDEATSSVDTSTEQRIMKLIRERLQGKTIISVLHRLEAALEYDRILVLESGKMLHFGTPAEVVRESELFSAFR